MSGAVEIRSGTAADPAVRAFLTGRGTDRVARRGVLVDALRHPAILAHEGGDLVGVLTYVVDGPACEVLTLHCARSWSGIGTALLDAVAGAARARNCTRLWVVTTNDNVDALRFYQRRGFRLTALRPGAVDESRLRLKPGIAVTGAYGIALRDELELIRPI